MKKVTIPLKLYMDRTEVRVRNIFIAASIGFCLACSALYLLPMKGFFSWFLLAGLCFGILKTFNAFLKMDQFDLYDISNEGDCSNIAGIGPNDYWFWDNIEESNGNETCTD